VPRSFDLTAESPNTAGRIHATLRDETYWRARLLRFDDGILRGKITVDAPGSPVSGHGELAVTRVAGGSRLAGRGTVGRSDNTADRTLSSSHRSP
jgi:hypothetical protein